jgi:hypothetical protein
MAKLKARHDVAEVIHGVSREKEVGQAFKPDVRLKNLTYAFTKFGPMPREPNEIPAAID